MRFDCKFRYYPHVTEPDDFIRPYVIDIICSSETDEEVIVAKIALDYLDIVRAEVSRQHLYEVCDADSAGWEHVYSAIIEPGVNSAEIRRDFGFDEPVHSILFVYQSVFHPCLRDWQRYILDHVCGLFGNDSATVMWKGETDLSDKELASLGFRIVAGHDLLFRPNMLKNEYDSLEDRRNPFDIEVEDDVGEYVLGAWKKLEPDDTD